VIGRDRPNEFRGVSRQKVNWEQIEGQWRQAKGKLRQKWGKLTDDDLDVISGKKDVLVGRLQERYGMKKDEAERDVDNFINTI
jgi:uncharacterized protein YjbJ (UPF0337 family)